jgi:ribosome-binding protein aMBF1 (putative translation factor)
MCNLSKRIFEKKNLINANEIIRGLEEDDSFKKLEAKIS